MYSGGFIFLICLAKRAKRAYWGLKSWQTTLWSFAIVNVDDYFLMSAADASCFNRSAWTLATGNAFMEGRCAPNLILRCSKYLIFWVHNCAGMIRERSDTRPRTVNTPRMVGELACNSGHFPVSIVFCLTEATAQTSQLWRQRLKSLALAIFYFIFLNVKSPAVYGFRMSISNVFSLYALVTLAHWLNLTFFQLAGSRC